MISVIILYIGMLLVILQGVILLSVMLSVGMLLVTIQSVILQSAIMLNVEAP